MAITENSLLKGCRGRLGEFVIYQCREQTHIRHKGNYENVVFSSGQKAQQERIASTAILYRAAKAVDLQRYWNRAAKRMKLSGYNLFTRCNLSAFTGEGAVSDFEKLQLTPDLLQLPDGIELYESREGEWTIEWNRRNHPHTANNDRLVVALMKREDVFTIVIPDIPLYRRADECAVIRFPPEFKDYVHLYCYFCSATDEKSSESRYFFLTHKT